MYVGAPFYQVPCFHGNFHRSVAPGSKLGGKNLGATLLNVRYPFRQLRSKCSATIPFLDSTNCSPNSSTYTQGQVCHAEISPPPKSVPPGPNLDAKFSPPWENSVAQPELSTGRRNSCSSVDPAAKRSSLLPWNCSSIQSYFYNSCMLICKASAYSKH